MDETHIVALRGLPDPAQARVLRRLLPDAEWQWITRLRQPEDRLRSLTARALARHLLAQRLGRPPTDIALAADPRGKPGLAVPAGWHFNLAHSGDHVLAAVGPQPLGVDVEACPRQVDGALFRFATGRDPDGAGPQVDDRGIRTSRRSAPNGSAGKPP
jgi:4'-phosphopantetheinyl transferase